VLGGLTQSLIKKAINKLESLEQKRYHSPVDKIVKHTVQKSTVATDTVETFFSNTIRQIDPDTMTARQALELLYSLKSHLD